MVSLATKLSLGNRKSALPEHVGDPYWDKVSLLMHMDGIEGSKAFVDEKGHTVIPQLDAIVTTTQAAFGTGSLRLNNSGYLEIPSTPALRYGTEDFTIEFRIRFTGVQQYQTIYSQGYTNAGSLAIQTDHTKVNVYLGSTPVLTDTSSVRTINTWYSYAIVRKGNAFTMFRNGVIVTAGTSSAAINNVETLYIGRAGGYSVLGHMDEFRITKGVARYTTNYTPATEAFPNYSVAAVDNDPHWDKVVLLVRGDTEAPDPMDVLEDTERRTPLPRWTSANGSIDTTVKKFGAGSLRMPLGTSLRCTASPDFLIAAGEDFTVDFWFYLHAGAPTNHKYLFDVGTNNMAIALQLQGGLVLYANQYAGGWLFGKIGGGAPNSTASPGGWVEQKWYHLAISRTGGILRGFCDGVQFTLDIASTNSFGAAQVLTLNGYAESIGESSINMDYVRITKGKGRYTKNFTAGDHFS